MPEKSKNNPDKSAEKEEKNGGNSEASESGVKDKEKPKKMSHKDLESRIL